MNLIILAILITCSCADPQILNLKKILGSTDITIQGVEIGARLFVSSNDDAGYLKLITAKVGNQVYTLDNLARSRNADGTQGYVTITDQLTLSTTNDDTTSGKLTGFLYITTADQAKDPNFTVYVASGTLTIEKLNIFGVESTTVILNTNLVGWEATYYSPDKTALVSNIYQPETTTLKILRGIPSPDSERDNKEQTIFMNPVDDIKFFNHIEPLQVSTDSWFIKTRGNFSLTVENKWADFTNYQTTSLTTTGLIMTEFLFAETNIKFQHNPANGGISGTFLTVDLYSGQYLDLTFYKPDSSINQNYTGSSNSTQIIYSEFPSTRLNVLSDILPGKFYIQYFRMDGPALPTTLGQSTISPITTPSSTSRPVISTTLETTTKLGLKVSLNFYILVVLFCKLVVL